MKGKYVGSEGRSNQSESQQYWENKPRILKAVIVANGTNKNVTISSNVRNNCSLFGNTQIGEKLILWLTRTLCATFTNSNLKLIDASVNPVEDSTGILMVDHIASYS